MPSIDMEGVSFIDVDVKSFLKRVIFDWMGCRIIMNRIRVRPDVVFSMQNTGLLCFRKVRQVIYYHQSIPFYRNKWNPFIPSERVLFFYKRIYPFFVRISLFPATQTIVQIPYMKQCFISKFGVQEDHVHVCFPDVERIHPASVKPYDWGDDRKHFIFPSTPFKYKNHQVIIKALSLLEDRKPGITDSISIFLTFSASEAPRITREIESAGLRKVFQFSDPLPHDVLLSVLSSSTCLLFPSTIETIGLPLIEAAFLGLPIIVSNMEYAREVMKDYPGATFCDPYDAEQWALAIESRLLNGSEKYPVILSQESSWDQIFKILNN